MTNIRQSAKFNSILKLWKYYGIWFGRNPMKKHRYYALANVLFNQVFFCVLMTISLCYTPRKMEYVVPEVIFYFTEIAVTSKVFMIIIKRDKILEAFNLMDGKDLDGDDESSKKIIEKDIDNYGTFWKLFMALGHVAYSCLVLLSVLLHVIYNTELKLIISQFYFLSDDFRSKYMNYLFAYQASFVYVHMIYNISIDAFVAGLMLTCVTHLKVLNNKLKSLKLSAEEKMLDLKRQDEIQMMRLRVILIRYGLVLKYSSLIQDIVSFCMFIVFGFGSITVGVVLCQLLLPSPIGLYLCMIVYLVAMLLQIFLPAYSGSLISYESGELAHAAYCTEWIPRSESFKRSIRIFVERANSPVQITGLKIFTMSLFTFTSIIKTAYSFFTLIRRFQD